MDVFRRDVTCRDPTGSKVNRPRMMYISGGNSRLVNY